MRSKLSAAGPWAVPLLLVILFLACSIAAPKTFASLANLRVMIDGQATIVLLALAVIVPLRAGDFDLSISAVMILTGVTLGVLNAHNYPLALACLLALLIGPVVGLLNGWLVVKFGIDSFIATLGTMTILGGLASLISSNALITTIPASLTGFAAHRFLGFGTPVWAGWMIALLLWYVFEWTPCGRYLLFIGGNRGAARLAGLRVNAFRQGAFVFSGTLSSVVGLLYAGLLGAVSPSAGTVYLLQPITAAFLGASAIKLGRFNVVGTLVAIYLLAVGITGLQLLGLQDWIAAVFNGACLIAAVGFTILFRRAASN
ncbi:MAG TPA: ABC transporter permease [Bryobacteraceae bacterium]|nr:ABC transporter permease [Bryobacteraceae bacterium]